jgi:hypothetical protein
VTDETPTTIESLFAEWRKQIEAKQEQHKAVVESPEYQSQLARLSQLTFDFIATLRLCWFATTRAGVGCIGFCRQSIP